jgi:hypothetical protein
VSVGEPFDHTGSPDQLQMLLATNTVKSRDFSLGALRKMGAKSQRNTLTKASKTKAKGIQTLIKLVRG